MAEFETLQPVIILPPTDQQYNMMINQTDDQKKKLPVEKEKANQQCLLMKNDNVTLKLVLKPQTSDNALNNNQPKPMTTTNNNSNSRHLVSPKKRLRSERTDRLNENHEHGCKKQKKKSKKTKGASQTVILDHDGIISSVIDHMKNSMGYIDITDAKIILEKKLSESDIKNNQGRLAIPENQIQAQFLTHDEKEFLKEKVDGKKKTTMDVKVIMGLSVYDMPLSRWDYSLDQEWSDEDAKWKYVLKNERGQWTKLKKDHGLQKGDIILLVSFRSNNVLHFAIMKRRVTKLFGKEIEQYRM